MSGVERQAPAKLNLTLEVLGRRSDGYHEIRSVAVTCGLWDDVRVQAGSGLVVTADEDFDSSGMPAGPGDENSVETALALMAQERRRLRSEPAIQRAEALRLGLSEVALRLHKRIPAAAGFGGGSSDATASLLALDEYWGLGLGNARLRELAAGIGSDCPFFVEGGVQYMGGRGEALQPLPEPPAALFFCIVKPAVSLPAKTARLYGLLRPEHYTGGQWSDGLAQRLRTGTGSPEPSDLFNVFDFVADTAYGGQPEIHAALAAYGARAVHLCGAGPSVYGLFVTRAEAEVACAGLVSEGYAAWAVTAPGPLSAASAGRI